MSRWKSKKKEPKGIQPNSKKVIPPTTTVSELSAARFSKKNATLSSETSMGSGSQALHSAKPGSVEHSLTPKQKQFIDFISSYRAEKGYAPSQQEIADHLGFSSKGTVQDYLVRLRERGFLASSFYQNRGIALPPSVSLKKVDPTHFELPLLGRVAAGKPIEALFSEQTLEVPVSMISPRKNYFALEVRGDSMIEDGIWDGDRVVICKEKNVTNGQTVVALVDGEATIKRFYKKSNQVELRPANPNYESIWVGPSHELKIEGVLVGLIRTWK